MISKFFRKFISLSFCLVAIVFCEAKDLPFTIDSLWQTYSLSANTKGRIALLENIQQCYDYLGDRKSRDSVVLLRLTLADNLKDMKLRATVYKNSLEHLMEFQSDSVPKYLKKFRDITAALKDNAWNLEYEFSFAESKLLAGKNNEAIEVCKKLLDVSATTKNELSTRVFFLLGRIYDATGNKLEAFRNYSQSLLNAQETGNKRLEFTITETLAKFFDLVDNYQMAEFYLKKQCSLVVNDIPIDSNQLFNIYKTLAYTYFTNNKRQLGEQYLNSVLDFATRNKNHELRNQALTDYRSFLIQNRFFKDLWNLYYERYPEELDKVKKSDTAMFLRLSAYMYQGIGKLDSAALCFDLSEKRLVNENKGEIFMSNFYKRYGQLLLLKGDYSKAKKKFEKALELSETKKYYPYMVEITHYLDTIAILKNDILSAYQYSKMNNRYYDSFVKTSKGNELNQLEINTEESQLLFNQEKQNLRIAARHKLQLVSLGMGLLVIVITAIYVFINLRKQKKFNLLLNHANDRLNIEKQKSEDLLLNVLPEKVADELKEKGFAEARLFDNVTVLFTDFKGFTLISERLTPQELVNELHECFKGFDAIVTRHGVEKIKTVGDAYLAVCGLPEENKSHAENIVNAALEIRDFMTERKKLLGEKTFGIRLGVNTGSVVAGIVGAKKFAYDIWGDCVNIAARMEQNSDEGKVNISETTYTLVKEKFRCEYRGEIGAKNKGVMKMYFVEKSLI